MALAVWWEGVDVDKGGVGLVALREGVAVDERGAALVGVVCAVVTDVCVCVDALVELLVAVVSDVPTVILGDREMEVRVTVGVRTDSTARCVGVAVVVPTGRRVCSEGAVRPACMVAWTIRVAVRRGCEVALTECVGVAVFLGAGGDVA